MYLTRLDHNVCNTTIVDIVHMHSIRAQHLEIERGHHFDVQRHNSRKCRLCSTGMVESEYLFYKSVHCLLTRRSFLTRSSWTSVAKFVNIMSSNSSRYILKLARLRTNYEYAGNSLS